MHLCPNVGPLARASRRMTDKRVDEDARSMLAELRSHHAWLFGEHNYQVLESDFQEHAFGNSYVLLRNARGWLRIVRDRSLRSVEVSQTGREEDWIRLGGDVVNLPGFSVVTIPTFDEALAVATGRQG